MRKRAWVLALMILVFPALAAAAEDAGLIVALKGKAVVLRDNKTIDAILKDTIMLRDTVETKEASRLKMLFKDDSILTLSEKSRLVVREYLGAGDKKKGKSVFNLIEGKLRSLVGNNEFEVHTPTAVVAARGTFFITWTGIEDGIPYSGIAVLEGVVEISNINPAILGVVRLERGTTSKVFQNKTPMPSLTTPKPLLEDLLDATELQSIPEVERGLPPQEAKPGELEPARLMMKDAAPIVQDSIPLTPPIGDQTPPIRNLTPPSDNTPVTIVPIFP
jgi:hypothetical protein